MKGRHSAVDGTAVDGTAGWRPMIIRLAVLADAHSIVTVIRRSISELCVADHHNDPGVLGRWLENKTAANVRTWIESPRTYMVVADSGTNAYGVDSMSTNRRGGRAQSAIADQYPGRVQTGRTTADKPAHW